jgi:hypothetical protein
MIFREPTAPDESFQLPTTPLRIFQFVTEAFWSCAVPTLFGGSWMAA